MTTKQIDWNEANVETLKTLWRQGAPVRDIATAIGGSEKFRNAIISKANRIELGSHASARPKPLLTAAQREERDAKRDADAKRRRDEKKAMKTKTATIEKIKPRPVVNDGMPVEADDRYLRGRAWQPLPDTTPVGLEDLGHAGRDNACHWPLGDGPFLFCGAQAEDGKVYCATHKHLSTRRL